MGLFFREKNEDDKTIAKRNREKGRIIPKEKTVTNKLITSPNAKYLKETSKVLQLLLHQERDFYQSLAIERELQLIKGYLESPNEKDFEEVLQREKELELMIRFNKFIGFNIPDDKLETINKNFEIENNQLQIAHEKSKSELIKLRKQISELEEKEKQLMNEVDEQSSYIGLSLVMKDFLNNPNDSNEWGMRDYNVNGQFYKSDSWLSSHLHSLGYPRIFTDKQKPYFTYIGGKQ